MNTRVQRFLESRFSPILTGLLYLALAGVLFYVIGTRTKPEIEALLTGLIPKVLRANLLLIGLGVVLCRREITGACRALFSLTAAVPEQTGAQEEKNAAPLSAALSSPGVRLLLIVVAGTLLVTLAAPQTHRIYYDEDIYANIGQSIAHTGRAGMANYGTFEYGEYFVNWILYNKDPAGWPFLMSLVFQLFGTDETFAFYLNNLLFAGGILIVFFIVRLIAGVAALPALLAALVYALIPHNLIWSNTIAAENAAAVFGGLSVLCALAWLRTRDPRRLFLLAAALPFACAMRPESALIALWVFAATAINLFAERGRSASLLAYAAGGAGIRRDPETGTKTTEAAATGAPVPEVPTAPMPPPGGRRGPGADFRHPLATRSFWTTGLIAFALAIPHLWHFYAMSGESWGAEGAKFAASFFTGNLAVNGPYFFNNQEFPLLFTLLALIGVIAATWRRGQKGTRVDFRFALLMLLWFLLFWGIFLFFYAGSYKYGADVRFALVCFMPLAILAGLGGAALCGWLDRALTLGDAPADAISPVDRGVARAHDEKRGNGQAAGAGGKQAVASAHAILSHPEDRAGTGGGDAQAGGKGEAPRTREKEEGARAGGWRGVREGNRLPAAGLLVMLLLIVWLKFLPLIRTEGQEAWGARYDHRNAREFVTKIPNRAVVLTHIPTMFLLWGQSAIQANAGIINPDLIRDLMNRYRGHVYFHKSYWCNAQNDPNRTVCDQIGLTYDLEPVALAREQTYEYGLYRMTFKKN